jgi:hypothetical protein
MVGIFSVCDTLWQLSVVFLFPIFLVWILAGALSLVVWLEELSYWFWASYFESCMWLCPGLSVYFFPMLVFWLWDTLLICGIYGCGVGVMKNHLKMATCRGRNRGGKKNCGRKCVWTLPWMLWILCDGSQPLSYFCVCVFMFDFYEEILSSGDHSNGLLLLEMWRWPVQAYTSCGLNDGNRLCVWQQRVCLCLSTTDRTYYYKT